MLLEGLVHSLLLIGIGCGKSQYPIKLKFSFGVRCGIVYLLELLLVEEALCVILPICGCFDESIIIHVLKNCSYARLMWAVLPLSNIFVACNSASMCERLDSVRKNATKDELALFVAICWSIWGSRNKIVHENYCYDAQDSVLYVQDLLFRFAAAQSAFSGPRPPDLRVEWQPPPEGILKVNFDVSVRANGAGVGLGVVVRDWRGSVLTWRHRCILLVLRSVKLLLRGVLLNWQRRKTTPT